MNHLTSRRWSVVRTTAIATVAAAALAVAVGPVFAERNDDACRAWSGFFDQTVNELNNLQPGGHIAAPGLLANLARASAGVDQWC